MTQLFMPNLINLHLHCEIQPYRGVSHYFPSVLFHVLAVLSSLRYLCTKTDILTDPSRLPDEARQAVSKHQQDQQSDGTP